MFGKGDGSTTFNLPDLRSEFIRGYDDGRGIDDGRLFASSQDATAIRTLIDNYSGYPVGTFAVGMQNVDGYLAGAGSSSHTDGLNTKYYQYSATTLSGTGDNTSQKTRPRNVALLACIKY